MDYLDVEVHVKPHKTIADVRTVGMSFKCNKSSAAHKLKPRDRKRDNTKTKEAKVETQKRNKSRMSGRKTE
jgi:hypothetical protein